MRRTIDKFCEEWKEEILKVEVASNNGEIAYPYSVVHNMIKYCVSVPANTYWESHEITCGKIVWGIDLTAVDHEGTEHLVGSVSTSGQILDFGMNDKQMSAAKRVSKNFKYMLKFITEQQQEKE